MPMVSRLQRVFTWAWGLWIGLFLVIEGLALANRRKGDTLSEHVWWARGRAKWPVRLGIGGLLAWLAYHFLWQ